MRTDHRFALRVPPKVRSARHRRVSGRSARWQERGIAFRAALGWPHGRGSLNAGRWPSRAARGTGTALAALRETSNAPAHPTWSRTEHQAVSKSRARPGSPPGDLRRWDPRLSLDQLPASSAGRIHADLVADAVQRHVIAAGSRGPRRYDGLRRGSSGASCASRVARGRSEIAVPCISTL